MRGRARVKTPVAVGRLPVRMLLLLLLYYYYYYYYYHACECACGVGDAEAPCLFRLVKLVPRLSRARLTRVSSRPGKRPSGRPEQQTYAPLLGSDLVAGPG